MKHTQRDDLDELFSKCDAYLKTWAVDAVEYGQTPHLISCLEEFEQQFNRLKMALAGTEFAKATVSDLGKKLSEFNNSMAGCKAVPVYDPCDPSPLVAEFERLKKFVKARASGGE